MQGPLNKSEQIRQVSAEMENPMLGNLPPVAEVMPTETYDRQPVPKTVKEHCGRGRHRHC
jgi:hypothetical protein